MNMAETQGQEPSGPQQRVTALVLAYNAEWNLSGGIRHLVDTIKGTSECALCEITHGVIKERDDWKRVKCSFQVPFRPVFRNRAGPEVERATGGSYPAVLAETEYGCRMLLDRATLEGCGKDVTAFREAVVQAARREGLALS